MSKQFYFEQFSLVYERSLNVKIVLFQAILFSMPYLPTPSLGQDMTQGQFLSKV